MKRTTRILAGTQHGLAYYQSNAERQWIVVGRSLTEHTIHAILATDASMLLVGVGGGQALQSFDGGRTWSDAPQAPPPPGPLEATSVSGVVLLANPRLRGATAYARLADKTGTLVGAGAGGMMLFRSSDNGIHWEPAQGDQASSGMVTALVPDPSEPATAWAATDAGVLLRSGDAGRSWRVVAREATAILCLAAVAG